MKTYCISDIHGHFENLTRFINTLDTDDKVYVLGDVIDKGKDSIGCLQLIMNDKRFSMLLGNHEYMMFDMLTRSEDTSEYYEASLQWLNYNSGYDTYDQYKLLSYGERLKILSFIEILPLNIPKLIVNNRSFYLVHSCPHDTKQIILKDIKNDTDLIYSYVWDRVIPLDRLNIIDQIVIAGHSPVQIHNQMYLDTIKPAYSGKDIKDAKYIDIDGGLATNLPNSGLIALCLDDLSYKLY